MAKDRIKYVTKGDFDKLMKASASTRHQFRNQVIMFMLYRHGLRASELIDLRLKDLRLDEAKVFIKRMKNGVSMNHPIEGDELRLLRKFLRWRSKQPGSGLPWLFVSERGNQFNRQSVRYIVSKAGESIGLDISSHSLRHGCGYYLANDKGADIRVIQQYLGHKNIQNTVIYTDLAPHQFEGLFQA